VHQSAGQSHSQDISSTVADPDLAFGGGAVKLGGAKNVFLCLNTKGCLQQSVCVTQTRLSFVGQKVAILLVELCCLAKYVHG